MNYFHRTIPGLVGKIVLLAQKINKRGGGGGGGGGVTIRMNKNVLVCIFWKNK